MVHVLARHLDDTGTVIFKQKSLKGSAGKYFTYMSAFGFMEVGDGCILTHIGAYTHIRIMGPVTACILIGS